MFVKEFNNKNILITGGAGFIGSHLARRLVGLGGRVTIIDAMIPEYGGNLRNIEDIRKHIYLNFSDVRDRNSMKYLVKNQDYLFNLAGQTSHMDSMQDPFTDLEINSRAQLAILETIRDYNDSIKIVFASTRQVYGQPEYLPVDEKHPVRPIDVNGINKVSGEHYHMLYNDIYHIHSCALRLTNTYGPGMRVKDARQTFIGIWIRNLIQGLPIEVWGGSQLRDFNHINDVVTAFLLAATHANAYGNIYNLGNIETISLLELAKLLIDIYGSGKFVVKQFPEQRKKIDIGDYYSDFTRITQDLNWKPQVCLRTGLENTLNYYQDNIAFYI